MIDKKIFYCWFGGSEMSKMDKKCIASWIKYCPDYEIIKISEENYDWESNPYAKQNYEAKNWSGVSNAARLDFLCKESGFYLDTDVELFRSLDDLRVFDGGFITEFESGQPDSGVLGRGTVCPNIYKEAFENLVPNRILHKEFIKILYRDYDVHGEPIKTFDDGFTVLGEEFFPSVRTGLFTKNTYAIHYFENTWKEAYIEPTDGFYPLPKAKIFFGNKLITEQEEPQINFVIKNHMKKWNTGDMIGKTDYMLNPRVVKLFCKDFEAEKITYNRLAPQHNTVTPSGLIVTWI